MKTLIFVVTSCLAWPGSDLLAAAAKAPEWTAYADCAAAYWANARLVDPDRPSSMIAQMSDAAREYEAASQTRFRPGSKARFAVHARIERQTQVFTRQPREVAERVIDACPQLDDQTGRKP